MRAFFLLPDDFQAAQAELVEDWLAAAWRQAEHLYGDIEWDLRANHLLRDAVGLAWAGRFFRGATTADHTAMAWQRATAGRS